MRSSVPEHELASLLALDDDALTAAALSEAGDFLDPCAQPVSGFTVEDENPNTSVTWLDGAIPGYIALADLGRGGMGLVVEAREIATGRIVALKIPHAHLRDSSSASRIKAEIAALARVDHERVARLYGVIEGAGPLHGATIIVMERVPGVPLDRWLDTRPTRRDRVRVICEIADAIGAAHDGGVLHLDLKPGNVLIRPDGRPKVLDFGIAHHLGESRGDPTLTMVTHGFGSLDSIAPEQLEARVASPMSDVYALGALLYRALANRPPIDVSGLPVSAAAERIRTESPRGLRAFDKGAGRDLEVIAEVALAKDPHDRYPSAHALRDDLNRWLAGTPIKARPLGAVTRASRFLLRHPKSVSVALVITAMLVSITVVALVQAEIARDARVRAEVRSDQLADMASNLVLDITPMLLYVDGATDARVRIAEDGLKYLSLATDHEQPSSDRRAAQILQLHNELGRTMGSSSYPSLGNAKQGLDILSDGIRKGERFRTLFATPVEITSALFRLYVARIANATDAAFATRAADLARMRALVEELNTLGYPEPDLTASQLVAEYWTLHWEAEGPTEENLARWDALWDWSYSVDPLHDAYDLAGDSSPLYAVCWTISARLGFERARMRDPRAIDALEWISRDLEASLRELHDHRGTNRAYALWFGYRGYAAWRVERDVDSARTNFARGIAYCEQLVKSEPHDSFGTMRMAWVLSMAAATELEIAQERPETPPAPYGGATALATKAMVILDDLRDRDVFGAMMHARESRWARAVLEGRSPCPMRRG